MKDTVTRRTRILEIITALLMIRPTLYILYELYSYNDTVMSEQLLKYSAPSLLSTISLAIVIITRKYDRIWAKLLVVLSVAVYFFTGNNINYSLNIGRTLRSYKNCGYDAFTYVQYLFDVFMLLFGIAAGIFLIIMLFGKRKWKKLAMSYL